MPEMYKYFIRDSQKYILQAGVEIFPKNNPEIKILKKYV